MTEPKKGALFVQKAVSLRLRCVVHAWPSNSLERVVCHFRGIPAFTKQECSRNACGGLSSFFRRKEVFMDQFSCLQTNNECSCNSLKPFSGQEKSVHAAVLETFRN